jgi:hypothetical protein
MPYFALMLLAALAGFALAGSAAGLALALLWRRAERWLAAAVSSRRRAGALLAVRLVPAAAGTVAAAVAIAAFARHEPRGISEVPGAMLIVLAVAGVAVIAAALWRAGARTWRTHKFLRAAKRSATPLVLPGVPISAWQLDIAYPLVALAGVRRIHLLVARCVLDEVPRDELDVVLRHELAHARLRHNLGHLLLAAVPDALSFVQGRLGIERAWQEAAEEAADDVAAAGDPCAGLSLASALVRVARMSESRRVPAVPLLAIHNGGSVERRVRRLLEPAPACTVRVSRLAALSAVAAIAIALSMWLNADGVLLAAHHGIEWLVNARP